MNVVNVVNVPETSIWTFEMRTLENLLLAVCAAEQGSMVLHLSLD